MTTGNSAPELVEEPVEEPGSGRRGLDLVALVTGLVCLGVAAMTLTGWVPQPGWSQVRWGLVGLAVLAGLAVLVSALRRPGRSRPPGTREGS
jgi:hypothetical protein